jgi:hypothetical protein
MALCSPTGVHDPPRFSTSQKTWGGDNNCVGDFFLFHSGPCLLLEKDLVNIVVIVLHNYVQQCHLYSLLCPCLVLLEDKDSVFVECRFIASESNSFVFFAPRLPWVLNKLVGRRLLI